MHQEPNQLGSARGPDGSFDTGLADLVINQIAVEQQDIVTDPLLECLAGLGTQRDDRRVPQLLLPRDGNRGRQVDTRRKLANQALAGGSYYLNSGYSLAGLTTSTKWNGSTLVWNIRGCRIPQPARARSEQSHSNRNSRPPTRSKVAK